MPSAMVWRCGWRSRSWRPVKSSSSVWLSANGTLTSRPCTTYGESARLVSVCRMRREPPAKDSSSVPSSSPADSSTARYANRRSLTSGSCAMANRGVQPPPSCIRAAKSAALASSSASSTVMRKPRNPGRVKVFSACSVSSGTARGVDSGASAYAVGSSVLNSALTLGRSSPAWTSDRAILVSSPGTDTEGNNMTSPYRFDSERHFSAPAIMPAMKYFCRNR